MEKETNQTRISKVKKVVHILINTGDYTNIMVGNEYEETIEWKEKKDRQEKENAILNLLLENISNDINKVLEFTNRKKVSNIVQNSDANRVNSSTMGLSDLGEGEDLNG